MSDTFMAVLAVLIALAVFVPCALFASGKWRPGRDDEKPAASQDVEALESPDRPALEPPSQTWTQNTTNVALTWIRNGITVGRRDDHGPKALPAGNEDDDGGYDLDDAPPAADLPVWEADVDVLCAPKPQPSKVARVVRQALPWHRSKEARGGRARVAETTLPPVFPDVLPPVLSSAPDVEIVQVRVDAETSPPPAWAPPTDRPLTIDPNPVALEGVDMSDAPLVPSGNGSAVRLATAGQLRAALATGGFSRLMAWLRAFRKASGNTLVQANAMHVDALLAARRTRSAYMQALQAFQAVQADKLDRQMINRTWQILQLTQAQAVAAANLTRATAAFVVASGGQQPAVAAAVATLQRNHGGIAAAVKASPVNPVENVNFYRQ